MAAAGTSIVSVTCVWANQGSSFSLDSIVYVVFVFISFVPLFLRLLFYKHLLSGPAL